MKYKRCFSLTSELKRACMSEKMYRYKAQYSLDYENGIENAVLRKPETPEMFWRRSSCASRFTPP